MEASMIVVGDRFAAFADNAGVVTLSTVERWLDGAAVIGPAEPNRLHLGQGIPADKLPVLVSRLRDRGVDVGNTGSGRHAAPAAQSLTHKRRPENTLISTPREIEPGVYDLDLLIEEDSELLLDHVTGQHIQGMVLVEAARQTFLAVTTQALTGELADPYFVIKTMNVQFRQFLFPIRARIEFLLKKQSSSRPGKCSYEAVIRFHQLGECAAEVTVSYAAIERGALSEREAHMAQAVVRRILVPAPVVEGASAPA